MNGAIYIGIDLGGTRIKAVALDQSLSILREHYEPTNDDGAAGWKEAVKKSVELLQTETGAMTLAIGISAPGLPAADQLSVACMPGRLQGLEGFQWSNWLGRPAFVLNDAVAALMAEATLGAAKGLQQVVLITLGTGVGGAVLIDGKPYQGAFNKAGHIGHMVIDEQGDCDVTGMPGSLEECIGNYSMERRSGGRFSSTQELLVAVDNGDEYAKTVWLLSVKRLALGLASVINILSPETIVIGGGIAQAGNALFIPLQDFLTRFEWCPGNPPTPVVKAAFGDLSGAIGAACFAIRQHSATKEFA